jgi:hypothetical protein
MRSVLIVAAAAFVALIVRRAGDAPAPLPEPPQSAGRPLP